VYLFPVYRRAIATSWRWLRVALLLVGAGALVYVLGRRRQ